MLPLILGLGAAGILWAAFHKREPEAFISFSMKDARIRDLFVGQSKHPQAAWKFKDRSLHEPFSNAWKTQTAEIIKASDVVIVLVSENACDADGVIWEVKKAQTLGVPAFGVFISKTGRPKLPDWLEHLDVIDWTQTGISEQLDAALAED